MRRASSASVQVAQNVTGGSGGERRATRSRRAARAGEKDRRGRIAHF
jgi:hypothetical protein